MSHDKDTKEKSGKKAPAKDLKEKRAAKAAKRKVKDSESTLTINLSGKRL